MVAIVLSFFLCGNKEYWNLAGSLLGATALILNAKGNVVGQIMCVVFSAYYGAVSFFTEYYGEMITYLGMSAPMSVAAVISWLRHPSRGKKNEVEINTLKWWEHPVAVLISMAVTGAFYFILRALNTARLLLSTLSVFTSCLAVIFAMRRTPFFALAYAFNDIVLIALWTLAAIDDLEHISLAICFTVFLFNDVYGFINWLRIRKRQRSSPVAAPEGPPPQSE